MPPHAGTTMFATYPNRLMEPSSLSCFERNDSVVDAVNVLLSLSNRSSFLSVPKQVLHAPLVNQPPAQTSDFYAPVIQRKRKDIESENHQWNGIARKRACFQSFFPLPHHYQQQQQHPLPCQFDHVVQHNVTNPPMIVPAPRAHLDQHYQIQPQKKSRKQSQPQHDKDQVQPKVQKVTPLASKNTVPQYDQQTLADFFIAGSQGQLSVCERKALYKDGNVLPYLLVRLRGQSNTLPHDARLSVEFKKGQARNFINIHFARVRVKAGTLMYDFLPDTIRLSRTNKNSDSALTKSFSTPLVASLFSKKCWDGIVVRGPRMFVAFLEGETECHSLPMFVEISPTSNSPGYRDPVKEYPIELIRSFFNPKTFAQMRKLHNNTSRSDR